MGIEQKRLQGRNTGKFHKRGRVSQERLEDVNMSSVGMGVSNGPEVRR